VEPYLHTEVDGSVPVGSDWMLVRLWLGSLDRRKYPEAVRLGSLGRADVAPLREQLAAALHDEQPKADPPETGLPLSPRKQVAVDRRRAIEQRKRAAVERFVPIVQGLRGAAVILWDQEFPPPQPH
jgi:hypothetical protein